MDKLSAQQAALDILGDFTLRPHTTQATALDRHYSAVLRFCVAQADWSFARRAAILEPQEDGTYTLPLDCLLIRTLRDLDGNKLRVWQLLDRTIVSEDSQGALRLTYTTDYTISADGEPPDTSPTFLQYFVTQLAAKCAPSILGEAGLELSIALEQKANAYRLRAIAQDRMQDASNAQSPLRMMQDRRRNF